MTSVLERAATTSEPGHSSVMAELPVRRAECNINNPRSLWAFIGELRDADDQEWVSQLDRLRDQFASALRRLGVLYFGYQILRCPGLNVTVTPLPALISTFPDEWLELHCPDADALEDPVRAEALRNPLPFSWSTIAESAELTAWQQKICQEVGERGLGGPATLPIHMQNDVAALTVVAEGSDTVLQSDLLYLLAHYFHLNARRPLIEVALTVSARRRSLLSPRETQILELSAAGKVTNEISMALGISAKSVEFHIEGAKRKLNVANRTHAVAKAIMLGLLSFPS